MKKLKSNKLFKIGIIALLLSGSTLTLAGCSDDDMDTGKNNTKPSISMNYQKAKDKFGSKDTKKLKFYEYTSNSHSDDPSYTLSYYNKDDDYKDVTTKVLKGDSDTSYKEVIDVKSSEEPYVIKKDGDYYIHRPPYNQYNQPPVSGKVTDKKVVE